MSELLAKVGACASARRGAQAAFEDALRQAVRGHTLAEVADAAGLSRARVSQIVGPVGRAAGRPARKVCGHPPARYSSWYAADGTLCVCCQVCGEVLAGGA